MVATREIGSLKLREEIQRELQITALYKNNANFNIAKCA